MAKNLYAVLMVAAITLNSILGALFIGPDEFGPFMWSTFGAIMVAIAIYTRTVWIDSRGPTRMDVEFQPRASARHWVYWVAPILVTLTQLPMLLSGAFDDDMNVVVSALLFLMLAYMAMGLGVLATFLVMLPIEAIASGLIRVVQGKRDGVPALGWGLVGLLVIGGAIAYALGVRGGSGRGSAVIALLGIPGNYYVVSSGWLWVSRLAFALMAAIIVALVRLSQQERARKTVERLGAGVQRQGAQRKSKRKR